MPTYVFRCGTHGDWEEWRSIKDASLPECRECGVRGVKVMVPPNISVYATPNKGAEARRVDRREAGWDQDLPAYARLRKDGLQPKRIDGAHRVEQGAETRLEVEMGKKIPAGRRSEALDVHQELRENQRNSGVVEQVREITKRSERNVVRGEVKVT